MKKQPGVMLYFEVRPCLDRLSMEQRGQLFEAILDYGEYGIEPDFQYMLGIAWDFIKPRLDRDREHYEELVQKRSEAAQARWNAYHENHASASGALQTVPTATVTPNPNVNSLSQAVTTPVVFPRQTGEIPPFGKTR